VAVASTALRVPLTVLDHQRQPIARSNGGTAAYVELRGDGGAPVHGAGIDANGDVATLKAVIGAMNRFPSATRPPLDVAV
jgi:hypothetical protein